MHISAKTIRGSLAGFAMLFSLAPVNAQEAVPAKPTVLLDQLVEGMPVSAAQEVRVLSATFEPGQRTVFHTHQFPVTVYVVAGEFSLDIEGQAPVRHTAGSAFVEPPNAKMTGYNSSSDQPLSVLIFYVSDPETPFLDPVM